MNNNKKKLSIGQSDFKRLIMDNLYFVDKSLFIKDVVEGMAVLLYPRPRRFGKTLNLSMLKYFYDITEDNAYLFNDLAIMLEGGKVSKYIDQEIVFTELEEDKNAIWNFFLMCGYLRYDNYVIDDEADTNADLSIPNQEIKAYFKKK